MITRNEIIIEARNLIGTPFHHQGRHRKFGIDCIGLIMLVGKALKCLFVKHDRTNYSEKPTDIMADELKQMGFKKIPTEERQSGDLGLFWFVSPKRPYHVGIFTDVGILHTYTNLKRVIEQPLPESWLKRLTAVYSFPEVA